MWMPVGVSVGGGGPQVLSVVVEVGAAAGQLQPMPAAPNAITTANINALWSLQDTHSSQGCVQCSGSSELAPGCLYSTPDGYQ